ncbi:MAG: glycine cleavage system aminomethyltransferase GcvT [Methylococcales symbiont of Hymedesmia sp. n. MRB-2018]|nr:MAG: glycine cleavage system aminomethyltransferase GcvT [Methylococcales symbiont of Hymedesmia sp. n. MRB-2018]
MSELNRTALYSLHIELAAKMVDFAGYRMPLHYADGIIKEHLHCRQQLGFFDVSHMGQILIKGSSSATLLETLTPGNITKLEVGQLRYSIFTTLEGGIIDDFIIAHISENNFLLTVNSACKNKVFKHLTDHLFPQCQLQILQCHTLFSLQGPAASTLMAELSKTASQLYFMQCCSTTIDHIPCLISRCGYTGEDGFEISIDNKFANILARKILTFDTVKAIGLGARDTLRLEAGLSLYGNEFDQTSSPIEAGLSWTFRNNSKPFQGAEFILSQQKTETAKRLIGLIVEGKAIIRSKMLLYDDNDREIGFVSSGSYSPSLKKPIALAYIETNYQQPYLIAKVRKHHIKAQITRLPFVPHRYYR